jgi:hypothetical protein
VTGRGDRGFTAWFRATLLGTSSFVVEPMRASMDAWVGSGCPISLKPRSETEPTMFFATNYTLAAGHLLEVGTKVELHGSEKGFCRFCDRRAPAVTFKKEAHALPHALGNKSLTTSYECDECNEAFGKGIENDLGAWTLPIRWLAQIRGNGGLPNIKQSSKGGWRFGFNENGAAVTQSDGDDVFEIDEEARVVSFRLRRDPYHPVAVYKAFVKIALTIMPEEQLEHFATTLAWIRETDHSRAIMHPLEARRIFVPGPRPFDTIQLCLLIRRDPAAALPYALFVLAFGNEMFQLIVPCPSQDASIAGRPIDLPTFPTPFDEGRALAGNPLRQSTIDLSSPKRVKNEFVSATFSFESGRVTDADGKVRVI